MLVEREGKRKAQEARARRKQNGTCEAKEEARNTKHVAERNAPARAKSASKEKGFSMEIEEVIESVGFDCVGSCPTDGLQVREEVRDMCAAGRCQIYGHSWACPPNCGDLDAEQQQKERVLELHKLLSESFPEARVLSSGTCTLCKPCAYPDEPCRFPDRAMVSMEAAGLVVSDVCTQAGIPYNHGKQTIAYSSCVLI